MTRFFDITDLVRFARTNPTVSGIQRVQFRVLRELASQCDPDDATCLFATGKFSRVRACRVRDLFGEQHYDADRFLAALGIEHPAAPFTRRELYDHLARYPKGSLHRASRKAELLGLAGVAPGIARARMGLPPRPPQPAADRTIETWPIERLDPSDHLVMIGTNWNVSEIETLATRHGRRGGCVTQVVYDLIPYRHPEYCIDSLARKFSGFLGRSRAFTSHYVCISEATRRDLQDYLGRDGIRTPVDAWPLAHEFAGFPRNDRTALGTDPELERQTSRPFVLCVGTIEIRKNGLALLRAWQRLTAELGSQTPLLVFAGKPGWKTEAFQELLASDARLQRHVRMFPRLSDADLASLYQRCLFTAYPSLVEGWGLPLGEAAWFGKYSVASSASSLPEVCGDLVDYVAPTDLDGLVAAVKRGVLDEQYRLQKEQAIEAAPLRSWRDVATHFDQLITKPAAVCAVSPPCLPRSPMISYAQNFEDVVLNRVFHNVNQGHYIDIGAFDPAIESVTKHFYDRGWSGVNVEPVARFHAKFVTERPRDWNLNVVVGSRVGDVAFQEWGDSGLSTIRETFDARVVEQLGFQCTTRTLPMTTLAEITKQLPYTDVQFLKIDVEGAEREVLQGGEWRAFRPRVILLEAIKPKLPGCDMYSFEPTWFEWEGILLQNGYDFALFDGLNRYYYRREEPELRGPLAYAANVTDGFRLAEGHVLTFHRRAA
jgi:FkbM family methyltransferase